jgi:WD40 repeat protein
LIGMRGGEVYEISLSTHSSVLLSESHSRRQIHGLDVNPHNPDEYVSGGDDGVLRFWSILSKRCIRRLNLECAVRAIAWHPTKPQIIVGVGGDPSQAVKDGAIIAINTVTLEIEFEDRKAKKYISDIKFSTSGALFAYSSVDGRVYIHTSDNFQLMKMVEIPSKLTPLENIDFSVDEGYVRFSSKEEDLYVFSIAENELIASPMTTKDVAWASYNVPYAWETQGIWTPGGPRVVSTSAKLDLKLIATTYDDGSAKVHNFPCLDFQDPAILVKGIATQGGRLRFTCSGSHIVYLDSYCRNVFTTAISVPKKK